MTLIGQNHNTKMTNSLKSANKTQEEDLISARPLKALHRGWELTAKPKYKAYETISFSVCMSISYTVFLLV